MSFRPYDTEFAKRLDELGDALLACREACRRLVIETQWRPADGSGAAQDVTALSERDPPTPGVIPAVLYIYVTTAGEQIGTLGVLYKQHEVMHAGPLLRAVVEHCARALWVLQQGESPVEDRLARAFLETLLSAQEAKKTSGRLEGKESDLYQREAASFRAMRATAKQVFSEPILDDHGQHTIRGQQTPGPQECVAWMFSFLRQPLSEDAATGVYDLLSNLSHPTLYPHVQMWEQPETPGLSLDDHERRVRAAVAPFYNVLSMMISYHGWSNTSHDELTRTLDLLMPGVVSQ
jgi:hypothetical protein